ncbi:ABC transporter ATP-binding protein [Umezawaea sp. Da 62-37]|uniref:ABC transporter ATP-binding protein n=1 Tax=Umezawaea sp. Da 62-37 TaxID=3075927 RepID=UPI0028F6D36D|nr:ABC transporter ATP-binding protein [Umezawaea sp. Da 62-37]WNV88119.1 ABC transporter ATP-binding protein [Umezawaea sp. Da 62-37]
MSTSVTERPALTTADTPILPIATSAQTLVGLGRALRGHPADCALAFALTAFASVGAVAVPLFLGRLVDAVRAGQPNLVTLLLLTAAGVVVGAVFTALAQRATDRLGARIAADLRERVLVRALGIESRVLERVGSGDVSSRVTEDVENFVEAVPLAATVFSAVITILVSTAGFATLDWRLALAFTVVFPVYWFSLRAYLPKAGPLYAAERRAAAARGQVVLESLHGLPTVHAYDMADLQTGRVADASERTLTAGLRAMRLFVWFTKSMNAAEALGLSAILLAGYWLVHGGGVTVGEVTAAALLFHRLFDPLGTVLLSFDDVQRAGAALARIIGVTLMPTPPSRPGRRHEGAVAVVARGIHHSYDEHREVLHGVDLHVPAGTSLAVVGTSGAGKTTLAGILAGSFPASLGHTALVDARGSVDVDDLDAERVRDWIGMVSQETHVFAGTLRDDVTFAAPDSTDDQVVAALRTVGAAAWIAALPDGLDTAVGAGEHPLTAAQVQQLALARLLLRDPPVVVLDEATAEAGSSGARDLEEAAAALVAGRTAIVVAHRLTQARACDRIAVMADGRIEELGTHDELVALGGRYAELWTAWSRRY